MKRKRQKGRGMKEQFTVYSRKLVLIY